MIPAFLKSRLETAYRHQLYDGAANPTVDFTRPVGEPALTAPDSVSWAVFDNPVSLFIGGITAVLLELADPSVRTGVWEQTTFRTDPLKRMRRTGLAAMVTVYGARSTAEQMVGHVRRIHESIRGETPAGLAYRANDPELLRWVHATAAFGFLEAYRHYVQPVSAPDRDRFYAEGAPVARLYGAESVPVTEAEFTACFAAALPRLERSEIIFEFLEIMRRLPLLPRPLRFLNELSIRAAVEILPPAIQQTLGLSHLRLHPAARRLIAFLGKSAGHLHLAATPANQARIRLAKSPEQRRPAAAPD
jgi:uncharacterized protein (DUF2236 family)